MATDLQRARGACLAGALLLVAPALAQEPAPTPEQLFEQLAPSVWTVETFDGRNQPLGLGSAVVVGPGSLVTNCHVLAKAQRVAVSRENVSYGATLEHPDPERDLCLLRVRNFTAPPVSVASLEGVKVGARVYAIGSPRGLEQTISDGLLSGVRRNEAGDFTALQVTVPISRGSSGGGLFDAQGRLIGITTFSLRDAQNVNFALPASWIAQVPERARAMLASRSPAGASQAQLAAPVSRTAYEYRLTDRTTGVVQTVTYQLDRVDGERLYFNAGSRIERRSGEVEKVAAGGGEADASMPPGGWYRPGVALGSTWKVAYPAPAHGRAVGLDLEARVVAEPVLQLAGRELRTVQVEYTGFVDRAPSLPGVATGRYKATAWFAPELGRVVRFEVYARGGVTGAQFIIDERLELVAIR